MPSQRNSAKKNASTNENGICKSENPTIIYEKCITCPDLGVTCNGPNMLTLPIESVREMVRRWKDIKGLTNEQLAAICKVPRGTVDRFLAGTESDFKYTTVSMINNGIVRYGQPMHEGMGDHPCPASSSEIRKKTAVAEQRTKELEQEVQQLQKKLSDTKGKHIADREQERKDNESRVKFLKNLATMRLWVILALSIVLLILLIGFARYVYMDITTVGFGFIRNGG